MSTRDDRRDPPGGGAPVAGSDPSPEPTAARTALAPLQAEHDRLTADLAEQQEAVRLGVAVAIEAAAELEAALDRIKAPLAAAKRRVEKAVAAEAAEARKRAEAAERERCLAIARHARTYRDGAARVESLGQVWAQLLRDQLATGALLAAAIGTDESRRLFGNNNVLSRVRETMAPAFVIAEGRADRLLPWPCNPASSFGRDGFETTELQSLAAVVRVFDDPAEAEAIRARLDPGGADWHVLPHPVDGLHHLVHAPLRGKARAAALGAQAAATLATGEE